MSIYIKGMEMPKSCWDCEVGGAKQMDNGTCTFYSMEYWEQKNYQDKIADGCPLVPVPEHGRLIDADAMLKKHYDGDVKGNIILRAAIITPEFVKNLPTIIPADKEGEG